MSIPKDDPMSRALVMLLSLVVLAACGSAHAVELAGPSPAREQALDCAMGQAAENGFYPLEGGISDGYVRLARRVVPPSGKVWANIGLRLLTLGLVGMSYPEYEHLTLTGAGGTLRVPVVGIKRDGGPHKPTREGVQLAEQILAACGAGR